jgi:hypothetical protein
VETVFINGCAGNCAGSYPGLFRIHSGGNIFTHIRIFLTAGMKHRFFGILSYLGSIPLSKQEEEAIMKNTLWGWACGIGVTLGLPLGCIVAFESGNLLSGLGSLITVLLIGLWVCRKEILREYKNGKGSS